MKYFSYLVVFFLISVSCSKRGYGFKENVKIEQISICYSCNHNFSTEVKHFIQNKVDSLILIYNTENHIFKLRSCNDSSENILFIKHDSLRFVSKHDIVKSSVISTLGVGLFTTLLVATNFGFAIGYIQLPGDHSMIRIGLSENLTKEEQIKEVRVFNIDYSLNKQNQLEKHWKALSNKIVHELSLMEKELKKSPKWRKFI